MLLETELAGLLTTVYVQEVVVGKVLRDEPEGLGSLGLSQWMKYTQSLVVGIKRPSMSEISYFSV